VHHTNSNKSPTKCNNFSSVLLDVYLQHRYHHASKVKPGAATAVVELLMMGVRVLETW
jgi:hypothetical protein